jgi:hypothetical protein
MLFLLRSVFIFFFKQAYFGPCVFSCLFGPEQMLPFCFIRINQFEQFSSMTFLLYSLIRLVRCLCTVYFTFSFTVVLLSWLISTYWPSISCLHSCSLNIRYLSCQLVFTIFYSRSNIELMRLALTKCTIPFLHHEPYLAKSWIKRNSRTPYDVYELSGSYQSVVKVRVKMDLFLYSYLDLAKVRRVCLV